MTDVQDWESRCDWRNWPLTKECCTAFNCSMRPLPPLDDLGGAHQEIRKLRAELAEANKNRCDHCGAKINVDGCLPCGAPQCCPSCCRLSFLESERDALKAELAAALAKKGPK